LQKLDGTTLRKFAGETDEITWFLNIDHMPEELETTLVKLRKTLHGWFVHLVGIEFEEKDNLLDQISHIKRATDIDKAVEELARHKLKMFGGTFVAWQKEHDLWDLGNGLLPVLKYRSQLKVALSIVPEAETASTVRVCTGFEPPQNLSELSGIYYVEIDGKPMRVREINFGDDMEIHQLENPDDIPF